MIIFSPAKTMNLDDLTNKKPTYKFKEQTNNLLDIISNMDKNTLATFLKIKGNTLDLTFDFYQNLNQTKEAIKLYDGVSFKQITSYNKEYIKDNIFIMSALYGIVKGCDYIYPYRLDFLYKNIIDINLYKYWHDCVNEQINKLNPDYILNLASNEFFKMLDKKLITSDIYNLEVISDKKPSSVLMKKIRGDILNYSIEYTITKIKDYNKLSTDIIKNVEVDTNNLILKVYVK